MTSRRMLTAIVAVAVTTVLAVIVLLVVAAPPAETPGSNEGGPGLPVQVAGEQYSGEPVSLDAPLVLGSEGCFRLGTEAGERFMIWPRGFTMGGAFVVDPEGTRLEAGTILTVSGVEMPYDDLVAIEGPDGYWASVAGFCIDDDDTVLVADSVSTAD